MVALILPVYTKSARELTQVKNNTKLRKLLIATTNKSIIMIEDIDFSLDLSDRKKKKPQKDGEEDEKSSKPDKPDYRSIIRKKIMTCIIMLFDYRSEDQWLAFFYYYEAFVDSVRISSPIFDFTNPLVDGKYMEFVVGDRSTDSDSCESITTQAITRRPLSNSSPISRTNYVDNGLLCLYVSSMESLGHQEIVNPTMINNEKVAAAAFYGPSVGINYGDLAVYHTPKTTGREEIMDCDVNYPVHHS